MAPMGSVDRVVYSRDEVCNDLPSVSDAGAARPKVGNRSGDSDDECGNADDKIHTGPHKTAIMVGSIKCHIDYWQHMTRTEVVSQV